MLTINSLYIVLACLIAMVITVLLRALPFVLLKPLRRSKLVKAFGIWMPIGIMLILSLSTFYDAFTTSNAGWWIAPLSLLVTVIAHFLSKRQIVFSVTAGTICYVLLLALFGTQT